MSMNSLTELIEKDQVVIHARPGSQAELIEHLKHVDLSLVGAMGWVAEGAVGNVTLRPNYVGDRQLTIHANHYLLHLERSVPSDAENQRRCFLEEHGFSMDELHRVEEQSIVHNKKGTEVNYDVMIRKGSRGYLTVQTFYDPIKV